MKRLGHLMFMLIWLFVRAAGEPFTYQGGFFFWRWHGIRASLGYAGDGGYPIVRQLIMLGRIYNHRQRL